MGETVITAAKTPAKNPENRASQKKTEVSQVVDSPAEQILFLQRTIGNRAVERLIRSGVLQAKLKISQPGDIYEQEADRVSEQVMRMPEPALALKRSCPFAKSSSCKEKEDILNTKKVSGDTTQSSPSVESRINSFRDGGQPLPKSVSAFFESRFGQDFSKVRVHTGGAAGQSARDLNAQAYTVGHEIVFGDGRFAPGTNDGRRLIAHELTHVVQQNGPNAGNERLNIDSANYPLEKKASQTNRHTSQHIQTRRLRPVVQKTPHRTIMRSQLFTSTMEICRRLLRSRMFQVSQGSIRVTANAVNERRGTPECSGADYHITLNQKGLIIDSEYGTCEFPQGEPFSRQWTNLPNGDYDLTIWTNNTNPYCCLVGDILVEQQSGLQGGSCTQPPPGPLEILHSALDLAGLIPALGAVPDAINAGIYLIEGDWTNAGLSAVAIIPVFGEAATVAKIGTRTVVRVTGEGIQRVGREGIEAGLREARASRRVAGQALEGAARTRLIAGVRGLYHSFDEHAAQWFGRAVSRETHLSQWQALIERAAQSSQVFEWSTGPAATIAHLARIEGKNFVVQFFTSGPRVGELATAFVPSQQQLTAMLRLLGR